MRLEFAQQIATTAGVSAAITDVSPVGGGSINEAYAMHAGTDRYFVKINDGNRYPKMFELEAAGLIALHKAVGAMVPKPIWTGIVENHQVLLLPWIDDKHPSDASWQRLGSDLAELHLNHHEQHGWGQDNYIGTLAQRNGRHEQWSEFFAQERIWPLCKIAEKAGRLQSAELKQVERLLKRTDQIFHPEPPSLLHGDLWTGNMMFDGGQWPKLIDPAVYFGHRLMDLGMLHLFGSVPELTIDAYHERYPLPSNWREAMEVANLYPLLVHLNLFGFAYIAPIRVVLNRFGS